MGYLSASRVAVGADDDAFYKLWGKDAKHYYVNGKDNIPFHTIILPALLLGNGESWHLPDQIISSEYLTLEGRKISTSQNYAIWVKELLDKYEADSIRYYFIANGPKKRMQIFRGENMFIVITESCLGHTFRLYCPITFQNTYRTPPNANNHMCSIISFGKHLVSFFILCK